MVCITIYCIFADIALYSQRGIYKKEVKGPKTMHPSRPQADIPPSIPSAVFIDLEVNPQTETILDYGAVTMDDRQLHTRSAEKFAAFIQPYDYICGHNIIAHDMRWLRRKLPGKVLEKILQAVQIDTLYLSPLLFPRRPYHALVKDDKLQTEELSNPLNDAVKAKELFCDACNAYAALPQGLQAVFYLLLHDAAEFSGFFCYMGKSWEQDAADLIRSYFKGSICEHVQLDSLIQNHAAALAYCLALTAVHDKYSIIPRWVHVHFPDVELVMRLLRGTPCREGCAYCEKELNLKKKLKAVFGYEDFRTYDGEPLQERAAWAAVRQESLLAVFPTGGGKSLAFQLPALIAGDAARELTVVVSPLQSLMKDQVDHLEKMGIADAVTVNGLLDPIQRAEALERVESGLACMLYISPELLRSKTIERFLLSRSIARFVIDEAHCFSAWGQDFRVDYLYIGDFIRELQEKKGQKKAIPVSCFTATAKQKVISDIRDYFKKKLDLDLRIFAADSARKNLRYQVLYKNSDADKYIALRSLIEQKNCPAIVYVSRTSRTWQLAEKLCKDGIAARPFNGKMESSEKTANQEAFIHDEIQVIVATSAFGMGVDKANVQLVVHYDISDSLENYVQEAGRAGRSPSLQAECYVLFHENDLDKHFMLLNQTKLSMSEIQQVWTAVKNMTRTRPILRRSPLEIARQAGWEENVRDVETRVKTAVQALENAGYVRRGKNVPRVYATSILVPNMIEASERIDRSRCLEARSREYAKRILQMLISKRSIAKAGNDEAESRIDYISDILGIPKADVLDVIYALRQEGILADTKDLSAYLKRTDTQNKTERQLKQHIALENFLLSYLDENGRSMNLKELNEKAQERNLKFSSINQMKVILYFWTIKHYVKKELEGSSDKVFVMPVISIKRLREMILLRQDIAEFTARYLYAHSPGSPGKKEEVPVLFSVLELKDGYEKYRNREISQKDVEDALLYLSKTGSMQLEGGFLVLYNGIELTRLELNNKIRYKVEDYRQLNEFYRQKIQQIHIVGEYANMMVRDYGQAMQFVRDYFQMDYRKFIRKYFDGERQAQIERNITPEKYRQLFDGLSGAQRDIIEDHDSQYIVVAAGPGSGKTRVLVHKLAALLMLEDIKHEQLLMVTFSRAAATEFKQRLYELIQNAAAFVDIKTFHSYCFDLLGKIGRLDGAKQVVADAARIIRSGDVEIGKITKTVLVIDEAQDMDADAAALIQALMERNEEMRVIAVGDDDQNIYQFRGSDSKYLRALVEEKGAVTYELLENYRSRRVVVAFANAFAAGITNRMKKKPIISVQQEAGIVQLVRCCSDNLEIPVVQCCMETKGAENACILTNTNEEALKVLGLLLKQGRKAKLIQSNDEFSIYYLAEMRYFLQMLKKTLKKRGNLAKISDALWAAAEEDLNRKYAGSECLPLCQKALETFAQLNQEKYVTDLEEFVKESELEDFYQSDQETVTVSTIHKSKGREFDKVYLMLSHVHLKDDEDRRKLYVGITRAKKELYIYCNTDCLDGVEAEGVERLQDTADYEEPEEVISQLSHHDVYLDFYKGKQRKMLQLYSGMQLQLADNGLCFHGERVVCFSRRYQAQMKDLRTRGYVPSSARIRFVVTWRGRGQKEEYVVILPEIYYKKRQDNTIYTCGQKDFP